MSRATVTRAITARAGARRTVRRRGPVLAAAAAALSLPLAGCMTVHGETADIPSITPAHAASVLRHFTDVNNQASKAYDAKLVGQIEAGPLGATDSAGVTARHVNNPGGNPSFTPLVLSDAKFWIPRQVGWPKFFVADTASNRGTGTRWLLVFRRGAAGQAWRADFLAVVDPSRVPALAHDADGYVLPVPAKGGGLLLPPAKLGAAYAGYLQHGDNADDFAKGSATSQLRTDRREHARTANSVTQYADQAADTGDFAPVALRTKNGGALVFFSTRHQSRSTYRAGYRLSIDQDTRALMTGTPRTSVTLSHIGEQLVSVPRKAGATPDPAPRITFLSRLLGLVSAEGA